MRSSAARSPSGRPARSAVVDVPAPTLPARVASRLGGLLRGSLSLALLERLVNRGASALVTFGMALFVSPASAGAYAFGMLVLTFAQGVGEAVLRQIGVAAWRYETGGSQLRSLSRKIAWGGGAFVLIALTIGLAVHLYNFAAFLALTPLVPVAVVQGLFAPSITLAQYHGRWARLTRAQMLGGVLSLIIAVPLLPFFGILAGVLQTVVSEVVFAVRAGGGLPDAEPDRPKTDVLRTFLWPTAVSNLYGWFTGQSDRLVVTVLAGAGQLGLLSLTLAVARSASDAVLNGILNLLRSRLAGSQSEQDRQGIFWSVTIRAASIACLLQLLVTGLSFWPLDVLLKPQWDPALAVVPLMAACGVALSVMYSIAAAVIDEGRAKELRPANIAGLIVAVTVGALLSFSLPLGSLAAALGDLVCLSVLMRLVRHQLTPGQKARLWTLAVASVLVGGAIYLVVRVL